MMAVLPVVGCTSAAPHVSNAAKLMRQKLVRQAKADAGSGQVVRLGLIPVLADGTLSCFASWAVPPSAALVRCRTPSTRTRP
jgi:hypothetical protein